MRKFSAIVKVFLISVLLSVNSFADDFRYPESYMPGGEYRLFGSGRDAVSNLTGGYRETGNFAVNAGNIVVSIQNKTRQRAEDSMPNTARRS
ncbi:MAG: hypothetical protein J6M05_05510 [Cardiobacteriaceae bacterium]|nr:hypothetical protein [Cardiobacteriaceae bacterium]